MSVRNDDGVREARLKAGTTRDTARLKAGTTRRSARLKAGTMGITLSA